MLEAVLRAAVLAAAGAAPALAAAQDVPTRLLADADVDAVLNALYEECYEAGMRVEALDGTRIVCTGGVADGEQPPADVAAGLVHEGLVRHRIRFELADRRGGVRVWAYPWLEVHEPDGVVLEEEIVSQAYLSRVEDVLERIETGLAAGDGAAREPWREHYDSRREWRLDAHLHAVEHCDRHLAEMSRERIDALLARAGVQPIGTSLRDRCEELYEPVFQWGLARGNESPTVEGYVEHRASLPPAERCTGELALDAECR